MTDVSKLKSRPFRGVKLARELKIGLGILLSILVASILAVLFPPFSYTAIGDDSFALPNGTHWLGTDNLGRDTFTRLFIAAGTTLMISAAATLISAVLGTALGLIAGYRGGIWDSIIMRGCDVLLAIPAILMALIVRVIIGPGIIPLIIAMAIIYTPTFARVMRAPVLAMRDRDFVIAAELAGTPAALIAIKHMLPNALTPLMVQAAITASEAVLLEAGLSYLGQGVQAPDPSVGMMISEFQKYVQDSPLLVILPALVIVLIAAGWNLVADGLQATFSPRQKETFEFLIPSRPLYRRIFAPLLGSSPMRTATADSATRGKGTTK